MSARWAEIEKESKPNKTRVEIRSSSKQCRRILAKLRVKFNPGDPEREGRSTKFCCTQAMNPLTLVKRIQNINSREAQLGISEEASWHAKYKDSAYVYVGGIPFDLTEGDLLAVFAQ